MEEKIRKGKYIKVTNTGIESKEVDVISLDDPILDTHYTPNIKKVIKPGTKLRYREFVYEDDIMTDISFTAMRYRLNRLEVPNERVRYFGSFSYFLNTPGAKASRRRTFTGYADIHYYVIQIVGSDTENNIVSLQTHNDQFYKCRDSKLVKELGAIAKSEIDEEGGSVSFQILPFKYWAC